MSLLGRVTSFFKNSHERKYIVEAFSPSAQSTNGDVVQWLVDFPISVQNIELYTVLAEFFRRQGNFEKSLTIHSAMITADIKPFGKDSAHIETAQDYYSAGLLGHAEGVLIDLLEKGDEPVAASAFRLWLSILESERSWARCIELIEKNGQRGSGGRRLANLYCQQYEAISDAPIKERRKLLKRAYVLKEGVRALLMLAQFNHEFEKYDAAIRYYQKVMALEPKRVTIAAMPFAQLSVMHNNAVPALVFLQGLYARHPSVRVLEAAIYIEQHSATTMPQSLSEAVDDSAQSGLSLMVVEHWLAKQNLADNPLANGILNITQKSSLESADPHQCVSCGAETESVVWRCPQCTSWETVYSKYELSVAADSPVLA